MDEICATIAKESRSKWVYYSWRWLGCAARTISKTSERGGGITLARLEKLSGVSDSHISQLERGQEQPSLEVAYRLSKALECEILELFEFYE